MLVYKIINKINGHAYIGVTQSTMAKRWRAHIDFAKNIRRDGYLQRAIRKYGEDVFSVVVLTTAVDAREARAIERGLIAQYGTMAPSGYNMTTGGEMEVGHKHSPETRAKLSAIAKSNPENIKRMADLGHASRGVKRAPRSEEHRHKLSLANLGHSHNIGRVVSDETRQKLSETHKKRWADGIGISPRKVGDYKHSDQTRAKMKDSAKKRMERPEEIERLQRQVKTSALLRKGKARDPKSVEKTADGNRGQKRTVDQRKYMAAAVAHRRKISVSDVIEMKMLLASGCSKNDLAHRYRVSYATVAYWCH